MGALHSAAGRLASPESDGFVSASPFFLSKSNPLTLGFDLVSGSVFSAQDSKNIAALRKATKILPHVFRKFNAFSIDVFVGL